MPLKYDATAATDRQVVERFAEIAETHRVPRVHITHLEDAVGALAFKLTREEAAKLE